MTLSRAALWHQMIALSPLCSGSLHQQYLRCGKRGCRCRDPKSPQPHGPYYLWIRRIGGRQVNRTLRPGPELDRVREGIENYRKLQALFAQVVEQEEDQVLSPERGVGEGSKKNSRKRFRRA